MVCEAFACRPSEAVCELEEHGELVMRVLWTRNYARAKAAYEQPGMDPAARLALLADPMVQLVRDTDFALAAEETEGRGGG